MKLMDVQVAEYLDLLSSDVPAPGGGSVSALAGAQAAGLLMMVADLTLGKEKYAEYHDICRAAKEQATELYKKLAAAVDKDTEAFNRVSAAYKMPREIPKEQKARSKAIAESTLTATEVPYSVMEDAYTCLKLAKTIVGKSNPSAASDLGVCVLNLMSAVKGAWLNVQINLPGVKDEERAAAFAKGGQKLYDEAETMARDLYDQVLNQL